METLHLYKNPTNHSNMKCFDLLHSNGKKLDAAQLVGVASQPSNFPASNIQNGVSQESNIHNGTQKQALAGSRISIPGYSDAGLYKKSLLVSDCYLDLLLYQHLSNSAKF